MHDQYLYHMCQIYLQKKYFQEIINFSMTFNKLTKYKREKTIIKALAKIDWYIQIICGKQNQVYIRGNISPVIQFDNK